MYGPPRLRHRGGVTPPYLYRPGSVWSHFNPPIVCGVPYFGPSTLATKIRAPKWSKLFFCPNMTRNPLSHGESVFWLSSAFLNVSSPPACMRLPHIWLFGHKRWRALGPKMAISAQKWSNVHFCKSDPAPFGMLRGEGIRANLGPFLTCSPPNFGVLAR